MSEEEIMSEEAFNELIDNLEIIEKLTPYGRKAIKYWVNKLQKENKVLKTTINKQSADISNNLLELQQKDKQIDLMAEFINKQDIDEDICKNNMSDLCDEFGTGINCIKCIKQYFEKLAKEKKIKYEQEKG